MTRMLPMKSQCFSFSREALEKLRKKFDFFDARAKSTSFRNLYGVKMTCPDSASVHASLYTIGRQRIAYECLEENILEEFTKKRAKTLLF